jgi:hypothetical protein
MNLAAVIVETRPLPNLIELISKHMAYLPEDTRLYVFGSLQVEEMVKDINCAFINVSRLRNIEDYNRLLTSTAFWNLINEENILIFQHDSMLLRSGIEEFYEWDYVGAPWTFQLHGGNGGLSFRKKSAMLKVINSGPQYNPYTHGNEDCYFSNRLLQEGKVAPRDVCRKFSCETIFQLGTLGYHAIEKYLSKEQCEQIKTQYK